MNLASIFSPEAVLPHLAARDKKQALKLMAARAATFTGLSARKIYGGLMEREDIGCTGMGNGVCAPHARFKKLKRPFAIFASLKQPIEFGAMDGKPVDMIFLLLTPAADHTDHLKALALISRLLRDKQLCENLRAGAHANVMHDLLLSAARDAA
ncbi:MAG: PTS sugar transporter subunit IIA [Pseudomonadota bacterium]|nr:PTS sugar transporter subunit IIA [Pseudomonadota bacterium]MDE3038323.1 PTS sugar transporter subunit IIA [Pseudomonadota bacterium]